MDLDSLLNKLKDQVLRSLVAQGYRLVEVSATIEHIRERVRGEFAGSPLPDSDLKPQVTDAFYTLTMANGFHLPAQMVVNTLHVLGHLDGQGNEAISLWLGLFDNESFDCEGLWQMYVDYRIQGNGPLMNLPPIINAVFRNPVGEENEIMDYCEKQRQAARNAPGLQEEDKNALVEGDIRRLIAWTLATNLEGQNPQVAVNLHNTLTTVRNSLRRGYHTLLCELLKNIYQTIGEVR